MGRLLDLDPTLAGQRDANPALASAHVPFLALHPGSWSPEDLPAEAGRPLALMVTDGILLHHLCLADSVVSEVLGPGDLLSPRLEADPVVPIRRSLRLAQPARIAFLDRRIVPVLAGTPQLAARLLARAADQAGRTAAHRAIVALPRVEDRLLALFGHLGERWGRVGTAGLLVPLALTHEAIGQLIGARRPTVSLGLKALADEEVLSRRADGCWVVARAALARLTPRAASGPDAGTVAVVPGAETPLLAAPAGRLADVDA
jgi:CRP-like cAMP-binding protein